MISFLVYHKGTQGSFLNHLDMQQYLKDVEGYDIKFYCENIDNLYKVIKNSRRKYTFKDDEVEILENDIVDFDGIVITDFKTLISLKKLKLNIICSKLLITDSIELSYHLKGIENGRFYYNVDVRSLFRGIYCDKVIFLMPPSNTKLFLEKYPNLDVSVTPFFKHINVDVLNTIKYDNRDGYFYRWDIENVDNEIKEKFGVNCVSFPPTWTTNDIGAKVPLKYNETKHMFDYKNLIYRRRKFLLYEEQFGRLIFEYILLGKTVYFFKEKYLKDGLTDYLKHFDIKFEGNKIVTTKEELTERMRRYHDRPWVQ